MYWQRIKGWKDITDRYCEWCSSLNSSPSIHPSLPCLAWAREWPTFAILLPTLYTATASQHLINDANINTCVKSSKKCVFVSTCGIFCIRIVFWCELFFKIFSFASSEFWPSLQFQLIYLRGHLLWSKYLNGQKKTLFISRVWWLG